MDASKQFGFGAILFYVRQGEEEVPEEKGPKRSTLEPIFSLSRFLTTAKKNYWPTELEIAELVCVIKKTRHLIESSQGQVILQTDHFSILDIIQQFSITSTASTMRINIRLIRAPQFLHGFRLSIWLKSRKEQVVLDALSRLASANSHLP